MRYARAVASPSDEVSQHRDAIVAYLLRMVMDHGDAEDLAQETIARALEKFDTYRGDASLRTWLLSIATRAALDHLRHKKRWRIEAMQESERTCHETPAMLEQMGAFYREPEFEFDARSHVAFCLSCVMRTRPPEQAAALLLREVIGLGTKDAAQAAGVSESVLRHRLSAARAAMRDAFDGLCALVDKRGACRQCSNFNGGPVDALEGTDDHLRTRLRVLADHDWTAGVTGRIHALQLTWLSEQEG